MSQARINQLLLKVQDAEARYEDSHDGYGPDHPYTLKDEKDMVATQKKADAATKEVADQPLVQTHVCQYSISFMTLFLGTRRIMAKWQKPARELGSYGVALMRDGQYLQVASMKRNGNLVTVCVNNHNGQHTIELGADEMVDMAYVD